MIGNLAWLAIIMSLAIGVVNNFLWAIFGILSPNNILDIVSTALESGTFDQEQITAGLDEIPSFSIIQILEKTIWVAIQSLQVTFAITFAYVFYLRLVSEGENTQPENDSISWDSVEL